MLGSALRCEEILMCSTAIVCDVTEDCVAAWVMSRLLRFPFLRLQMLRQPVQIFRHSARGLHCRAIFVATLSAAAAADQAPRCDDVTALAALRITSSTASGWDSIGTWLKSSSTVLAPMRFAAKRCSSGLTVWSWLATMYQLGLESPIGDQETPRL